MVYLRLLLFCVVPLKAHLLSYDTAAAYAQKGKWQEAQKNMNELMIHTPDRPEFMYDSGVAAYRLGEFEKATAYFENVTRLENVTPDLQKQAHFNLGNTKVALNQLTDAIAQYEKVLAIEPDNHQAKHNLEKVKEMIKQQQSKNNQKQEQKKNKPQQNNKEKENKSSDQKNKQDNQDQSDTKQEPQKSEGQEKSSKSNGESQPEQSSANGNQEKQDNADNDQKGKEKKDSKDISNQDHRDTKQDELCGNHASPSQQQNDREQKQKSKAASQSTNNEKKEQGMQTGMASGGAKDVRHEEQKELEQQLAPHERWMARVLVHQEKADEIAQKELIKTHIGKQLAGRNGQNCW